MSTRSNWAPRPPNAREADLRIKVKNIYAHYHDRVGSDAFYWRMHIKQNNSDNWDLLCVMRDGILLKTGVDIKPVLYS